MTGYLPRTYTLRRRPSVEANRFDGTLHMARWLADQDDEHLTRTQALAPHPRKEHTMTNTDTDTTARQRAMATRWWTLTAPILCDPDDRPDGTGAPEPTPHSIPDSGIIQCKAAGVTVCAYDYGIGGYLSGHVYHGTTGYACFENATDDEITTLATHARHLSDLTETIDERRWAAYDALDTDKADQ